MTQTPQDAKGWQPIASAPKDGSPVLLWEPEAICRHDGIVITGTYVDFAGNVVPEGYHSGWFDDVSGRYEIHPTHWMPLPDPPQDVAFVGRSERGDMKNEEERLSRGRTQR